MILKRCKICGKLVWLVTDGACNACHTKHEQSKKLASTATHVSTPPHYCCNDDWQHNHRPAVLYDDAPSHRHCDTGTHHDHSSSFGSCSYDSSSDSSSSSGGDW